MNKENLYKYQGSELDSFEKAVHWKQKLSSLLSRWIRGRTLEVGAGSGGSTIALPIELAESWTCLEPDSGLSARIENRIQKGELPADKVKVVKGFLSDISHREKYDCILFIDVLEHIENDARELELAVQRLASNGTLVIVSPAWPFLYSPYDRAIGHYRRYTKSSLSRIIPLGLISRQLMYLDSLGMVASFVNRALLRSDMPSQSQIEFWDRWLVPYSEWIDRLLRGSIGRSILGVWENRISISRQ